MGMLFKSKRERERDDRRDRRRAFRQAENAADDVKDRIKQLEKKSKEQWEGARQALAEGRKAAANRLLVGYRAAQVIMVRLEQKRWVFEQHIEKLHAAESDSEFAKALEGVNRIMNIDPEKVLDAFDGSADLLAEQSEADREWNKLYEKEMEGAGEALEDHIPSLDELAAQLDAEAGAGIARKAPEKAPDKVSAQSEPDIATRIASGRARVDAILRDGEKPKDD
jgi:cell fate (sporulation/competence/biofilm development) regulator YmcA (YheA/YmcA/DUF963 family)